MCVKKKSDGFTTKKPMIFLVDNASGDDHARMTPQLVEHCRRTGRGLYVHPGHDPVLPEAVLGQATCVILSGSDRHAPDDRDRNDGTRAAIVHALFHGVPLLGICYGMHRLAQHAGAPVTRGLPRRGVDDVRGLRLAFECEDFVADAPPGFDDLLHDDRHGVVLMSNAAAGGRATGAAFHPEASDDGVRLLHLWLRGVEDLLSGSRAAATTGRSTRRAAGA